jgi:hypothetical protein
MWKGNVTCKHILTQSRIIRYEINISTITVETCLIPPDFSLHMKHHKHHELYQHSFLVSLTSCHITKDAHNTTIPAIPTTTYDMHIIYIPTQFITL